MTPTGAMRTRLAWRRMRLRRRPGWFLAETAAALAVLAILVGTVVVASRDWGESTVTAVVNERAAALLDAALSPAAWADCVPTASRERCDTFLGSGGVDNPGDDVHVPDGPDACPASPLRPPTGCTVPTPGTNPDAGDLCPDDPGDDSIDMAARMTGADLDVAYCVYVWDRHEFNSLDPGTRQARQLLKSECRADPADPTTVLDLSVMPVFAVRDALVVAYRADNPDHPTRLEGARSRRLSEAEHSWTSVWLGDLILNWASLVGVPYARPVTSGDVHFGTRYADLPPSVTPVRFGDLVWVSAALADTTATDRAALLDTAALVVDDAAVTDWTATGATRLGAAWRPGSVPDACVPIVVRTSDGIRGVKWMHHSSSRPGESHHWTCGMWLARPGWNPPPQADADLHNPPPSGRRKTPGSC